MKHQHSGIQRIILATKYSLKGLRAAFQFEASFRQELYLCTVLVPIVLNLPLTTLEKTWMVGSLFALLIVELLNSAIEAVVDRVGAEHHELSGRAKDIASAAVMTTMIMIAVTWLMILWQPLLDYIKQVTS